MTKKHVSKLILSLLCLVFIFGGCQSGGGKIRLSHAQKQLDVGATFILTAELNGHDGKFDFSAADTTIVSIKSQSGTSCLVEAIEAGETTVTVKGGGASAKCKVSVVSNNGENNGDTPGDGQLALSESKIILPVYKSVVLSAAGKDINDIVFSSGNPSVADVGINGTLTAYNEGETVITASVGGDSAECVVTVIETGMTRLSGTSGDTAVTNTALVNGFGRVASDDSKLWFYHTASGFEAKFYGTRLSADLYGSQNAYLSVLVDGDTSSEKFVIEALSGNRTVVLAENLAEGFHTVKVLKRSEAQLSEAALSALNTDGWFSYAPKLKTRKIEVYGDSITAGYGNTAAPGSAMSNANTNGLRTYAYLAAQGLNAQINVFAYSGWGLYTSRWSNNIIPPIYDLVSQSNPIAWDFSAFTPDVVMINLGTNDYGNAGGGNANMPVFTQAAFKAAYKAFVTELRTKYPAAQIVCIYGMMDNSAPVKNAINDMIAEFAVEGESKVSFLNLTSSDNSAPGSHPSAAGNLSASATLTDYLSTLMGW